MKILVPRSKLALAILVVCVGLIVAVLAAHKTIAARIFIYEFKNAPTRSKEAVATKFLRYLSVDELLTAAEKEYRVCHSPSHEIGKAVFAMTNSIGESASLCANRCGSGCFHGAMMKMFSPDGYATFDIPDKAASSTALKKIALDATEACKVNQVHDIIAPWRCGHAIGHALMFSSGYKLDDALKACSYLPAALVQICRSGVFMEFVQNPDFESVVRSAPTYPCDRYPEWSCFANRSILMFRDARMNVEKTAAVCEGRPKAEALECIRGIGAAIFYFNSRILRYNGGIEEQCGFANAEEQAACINGAIRKFATITENTDDSGCDTVADNYREACVERLRNLKSLTF